MTQYKVATPVPGFTGVSAGINFTDGVAVVGVGPSLAYFRGAGYHVEEVNESSQADAADGDETQEPPAAADVPQVPAPPAGNASTDAWRSHAIARGLPADEVEDMSRDDIKDRLKKEGLL